MYGLTADDYDRVLDDAMLNTHLVLLKEFVFFFRIKQAIGRRKINACNEQKQCIKCNTNPAFKEKIVEGLNFSFY